MIYNVHGFSRPFLHDPTLCHCTSWESVLIFPATLEEKPKCSERFISAFRDLAQAGPGRLVSDLVSQICASPNFV